MYKKKVNPLFHFLAKAVEPNLYDQITYLKAENEVLRSMLPKHIRVTKWDKQRLLKASAHLGASVALLLSIVSYRTFQRWRRGEKCLKRLLRILSIHITPWKGLAPQPFPLNRQVTLARKLLSAALAKNKLQPPVFCSFQGQGQLLIRL